MTPVGLLWRMNMPRYTLALFLIMASMLSAPRAAETAEPVDKLSLDDQVRAVLALPEDIFKRNILPAIDGGDEGLRWIAIVEGAGQPYGLRDGVYLFDKPGVFFLYQPTEQCDAISLSPNMDVIALAEDVAGARRWRFHSFPDMAVLGEAVCPLMSPDLFWSSEAALQKDGKGKDVGVAYTAQDSGAFNRRGGGDNGGEAYKPRSLAYFDFAMGREQVLLRATARYDYVEPIL